MPSLQSRICRLTVNRYLGAKIKKAGQSIPALRSLDEQFMKYQNVPAGTEISPVTVNGVPAEWVRASGVRGAGVRGETVVLYLHGGAFVMGSPATHRELTARLSAAAKASFLVLDYRLSPEYAFPAAMEDVLASFRWLLDEGYGQEQIVFGGDSAGGGLALQSLITLRDGGSVLPAGAFMLSPPTDWVRFDGESFTTRRDKDHFISLESCKYTGSLYVGDNDPANPLFCPHAMDLSGLPSLLIHVGDHEVLLSDAIRLAERAQADKVDVEFKIWPGMWHVFQTTASYVPESRQSINEIGRFVAGLY